MPAEPTGQQTAHQDPQQGTDSQITLEDFDLNRDHLHQAARAGVVAALNITPYHPVTARGFVQWADTVASLRKQLSELGWELTDHQNSPRVITPDKHRSIMVAAGDKNTGRKGKPPRFARRRGPATRVSVEVNGQQTLPLRELQEGLELNQLRHRNGTAGQPETWVLLYCWVPEERRVHLELSLPSAMDDEGQVTEWAHRIPVDDLMLDAEDLGDGVDMAAAAQDVDFRITEVS